MPFDFAQDKLARDDDIITEAGVKNIFKRKVDRLRRRLEFHSYGQKKLTGR